jgi:hypothetical protein
MRGHRNHDAVLAPVLSILTETPAHRARPRDLLDALEDRDIRLFEQSSRTARLRALTAHLWEEAERGGRVQHAGRGLYGLPKDR